MTDLSPSTRNGRPLTWFSIGLALVFSLLLLYLPFEFQSAAYQFVYPYLRWFGVAFAVATIWMAASLMVVGLPRWWGPVGMYFSAAVFAGLDIAIAILPGLLVSQVLYGSLILVMIYAATHGEGEPAIFEGLATLLPLLLGITMALRQVSQAQDSELGSLISRSASTVAFLLVGLVACGLWILARHRPWNIAARMFLVFAMLAWHALQRYSVDNWTTDTVDAVLAIAVATWGAYQIRPWRVGLPALRRRILVAAISLSIIPLVGLGAVAVGAIQMVDRDRALDSLRVHALLLDRTMEGLISQNPSLSGNLEGLRDEVLKALPMPRVDFRLLPIAGTPERWPLSGSIVSLEELEPRGERHLVAYLRQPQYGTTMVLSRSAADAYTRVAAVARAILVLTAMAGAGAIVLSVWLARRMTRDLHKVKEIALAASARHWGRDLRPVIGLDEENEVTQLAVTIEELTGALTRYNQELKSHNAALDLHAEELERRNRLLETQGNQLQDRADRQAVVTRLGLQALAGTAIPHLMDTAVNQLAQVMKIDLSKVMRYLPEEHLLVFEAGSGWPEGLIGRVTVGDGANTMAAYLLATQQPLVVTDLRWETRFASPLLTTHGVISGVSVLIPGRDRPYGVLSVHSKTRRDFAQEDVHFLQAVANVLATAVERRQTEADMERLLTEHRLARLAAEEAEQRLTILTEAGAALSASLDCAKTLQALAETASQHLEGWCAVHLLTDDRTIKQIAVSHPDPAKAALIRGLHEQYPPLPDAPFGISQVLMTGQPKIYPSIPLHAWLDVARDEEHNRLLAAAAGKSAMIVPIIAHGRVLGAIALTSIEPKRTYGTQDLTLVEELARRAAVAVENARLYEEARETARESEEGRALLDTLIRTAPTGFVLYDSDLRVVRMNEAMARIDGFPLGVRFGKTLRDLLPEIANLVEPFLRRVVETREPVLDLEFSGKTPAHPDEVHHWSQILYPVETHDGQLLGIGCFVTDITERKRVENELRYTASLLRGEQRILEMVSTGVPLDQTLVALAVFIEHQSEDSTCCLFLLDASGQRLRLAAAPSLTSPERMGLDDLPTELIAADGGFAAVWPTTAIAQYHFVPVVGGTGEALGRIAVRYPSDRHSFDTQVLETAAHLMGIAIERHRVEQAGNLKLQSLIEQMAEGVIAVDQDGHLLFTNPTACRLLDLPTPISADTAMEAGFPEPLAHLLRNAAQPECREAVRHTFTHAGREVEAYVSPVTAGPDGHYGAIAILRDATAEVQLRRLQESIVANVSHELRGPLASLSAVVEALHDGMISEDARPPYLKAMLAEISRMRRLTHDLLELSRLDAGMVQLDLSVFDMADVCAGMASLWQARCVQAGLLLHVECPSLKVLADLDRVHQILANFVENAIRFTAPGGTIRLSAVSQANRALVRVVDTGIGIPKEHLPFIWDRFYKVDQARVRSPQSGTGLGLAISKHLIEAMGGNVEVQSEPGQGTTFSFSLLLP